MCVWCVYMGFFFFFININNLKVLNFSLGPPCGMLRQDERQQTPLFNPKWAYLQLTLSVIMYNNHIAKWKRVHKNDEGSSSDCCWTISCGVLCSFQNLSTVILSTGRRIITSWNKETYRVRDFRHCSQSFSNQ